MGDVPREALTSIIANYGAGIAREPQRCKALLRDLAGDHRREVNLLILAQEHNVPADLLTNPAASGTDIGRLATRLRDDVGIQEDLARWAVETWAFALGLLGTAVSRVVPVQAATSTEAESWLKRGIGYAEAGLTERAIAALSKAIELQPDLAEAYFQRAEVNFRDEPQRAIEDYTEAIILNPKHYYAYTARGRCFGRLGDSDRAFDDLRRGVELAPDDEHPYSWLYHFMPAFPPNYGESLMYSIMADAFSKAIQCKPDFHAGYLYRARTYFDLKEYDRAITDYTSVIALRPDNAQVYYYRAQAHSAKGDHEQAQTDLQNAIELGTDIYWVRRAQEELRKLEGQP